MQRSAPRVRFADLISAYSRPHGRIRQASGLAAALLIGTASTTIQVAPPPGSQIAFSSERDGNAEIYVMYPNGSSQTRLTNNAFADYAPDWSPDGQRIVFASDRN